MKHITQPKPSSIGLMAALLAAATWGMVGIFVRWPGWSAFTVLAGRFLVATAAMLPIVLLVEYPTRFYSLPPHSANLVAEFAGDRIFVSGYYGISDGTRG